MTVLKEYQRLEASGLYRTAPDAQRREVIVALGDATLVISDMKGVALAHWSLPALEQCAPPGVDGTATYRPSSDAQETLETDDPSMIAALEKVHNAIERARPHPGRLRNLIVAGLSLAVFGLATLWLPGALVRQTAAIVPMAKRSEIGLALLEEIRRVAGARCDTALGTEALARLRARLLPPGPGQIVVLSGGVTLAEHLPGRIVLLNRSLVEDYEDPAVAAGYVLAETQRAATLDPLERLLQETGLIATFRLLTTGRIAPDVLATYAEDLLTTEPVAVKIEPLLARFAATGVSASPYAYAIDITGESVLPLIEADPVPPGTGVPVLSDGDWVSLQGICGE